MAQVRKISKEKGVQICVDRIYSGVHTKEILREITENYGKSVSAVEKWMKEARPIVADRLKADEEVRRRESEVIVTEAVKTHGVTKERLIARLAQIALGDVTNIFTVDGGLKQISEWDEETAGMIAGLDSFDERARDTGEVLGTMRKVKLLSPLQAIEILNKMLGYNMPDKVAATDSAGKDVPSAIDWDKVPVEAIKHIINAATPENRE